MNTNKTVEFYLDFSSPYSYLALPLLKKLIAKYDLKLIPIPILIGYIFKKNGTTIPALDKVRSNYFLTDFIRSADFYNITMTLPKTFPFSSLILERLYWCVNDISPHRTIEFITDAFEDIFVNHKDLITMEDCNHLVNKFLIPSDMLTSTKYKNMPFKVTTTAHEQGVFGVPFIKFGKNTYWGVDRIVQLEKTITNSIKLKLV